MSKLRRERRAQGPPGALNPNQRPGPQGPPKLQRMKKLMDIGVNEQGHVVFTYDQGVPLLQLEQALNKVFITFVEMRVKQQLVDASKPPIIDPKTGQPAIRLKTGTDNG